MLGSVMFSSIVPLVLGWLLDYFYGDPEKLPHPIVWFGKWIARGERILNRGKHRLLKGGLFAVFSIMLVYILGHGVLRVCVFLPFPSFFCTILSGVLVFYCLAGHTLRKEVRLVFEAVERGVGEGRRQVSRIVGRDTSDLSPQEVRTAALETLAENLSDGVIAPLFWFFVLGVPGMLAYKMVNTLDSMIGYKNARYKDFGCWAAKIDDVANYIPARLTAVLMLAYKATMVRRRYYLPHGEENAFFTFRDGISFVRTFGPHHSSPNSGWPEAALAYILNCRFGGTHVYFGENVYKPYIGTNPRMLSTEDMHLSIAVCFGAECLMLLVLILLYFLGCLFL